MAEEHLKNLNDDNFADTVDQGVTLVDFYADWCGPCRMVAPIVKELAAEMSGKANVAKLDIESAQQTTTNFRVTSIPTIIIFKDGKEVERFVGVKDKATLEKAIEKAIG